MTRRERGFALLIVLWSLVIISLLLTQILSAGRGALRLADTLRGAAIAQACADGAINEALLHIIETGPEHWPADGSAHRLSCGGLAVTVRGTSLADKLNPNLASTALLAGLFGQIGAGPDQAMQLAQNIVAWRSPALSPQAAAQLISRYRQAGLAYGPPGRAFADLSALGDVMGMTPALLAAAKPYMSLYAAGDPDPAIAPPALRRALKAAGQTGSVQGSYNGADMVVSISAEAAPTGPRRVAIVSITGAGAAVPFRILAQSGGY